jgi:hypothetical protein
MVPMPRAAEAKLACRATASAAMTCAAMACAIAVGCSSGNRPEQYIPSSDVAHAAVASMLEAWRNGVPAGPVKDGASVQVADSHRTPNQNLVGYEILGETAMDSGRRFVVRLELDNPPATQTARYVVLGIDPLWVFRQEDFDMIAHWDHPMPADGPASAQEASSSDE